MLRRVRDKLYQDGAGLPPQGRTVRCPSLSPPARGTAPFWGPLFNQPFGLIFPWDVSSGGATPQTPRCGLRPQIALGFPSSWLATNHEMIFVDKGR
jgi:hypothetical protein